MQRQTKRALAFLLYTCVAIATSSSLFLSGNCMPLSAKWIEKSFYYDIDTQDWQYPPITGLNVTFGVDSTPLYWQLTDCDGTVLFGSGLPDDTYWMEWLWGGQAYHEDFTINCSQLVWHFDNYLPAKGRGTYSRLPILELHDDLAMSPLWGC